MSGLKRVTFYKTQTNEQAVSQASIFQEITILLKSVVHSLKISFLTTWLFHGSANLKAWQ